METKRSADTSWTNTHFYDNNISQDILDKIESLMLTSKDISKEDKLLCFDKLRNKLKSLNTSVIAMKFYDQIIESYVNDDGKNYDPINKLEPIDLLHRIFIISETNHEITVSLKEQLEDMKTGFCPQGRSIRLIQIINAFR